MRWSYTDDEGKFDLVNGHTSAATDKVPVKKMVMRVDIDEREPDKGRFDQSWVMKVAKSVRYGKDVQEIDQRHNSQSSGVAFAVCNHARN